MLHWFAGAKVQDFGDVDATGYIEPPETPAPVFAVRAFKHAIFGTPGTVQPKALRRHSNTENGKSRTNARPAMGRPKSSGDTYTLGINDDIAASDPVPLSSPTKGILMTPGTAAARRKTVSFGAHVQDNEGKRQGKSGLPDSYPGKFPSPFVKTLVVDDSKAEVADKARGRNKLTEKLEQAREDSVKRKSVQGRQSAEPDEALHTASNLTEHAPEHWRIMFEEYRERSERECRKLLSKQRAAKSFAREKDVQLMDTADQLRQEKKKVDRLERQVANLQAELMECQERLRVSQAEEQTAQEEVTRLKRGSGLTGYRRHGEVPPSVTPRSYELEKPKREIAARTKSHDGAEHEEALPRTRGRTLQPEFSAIKREHDDTWAPSLAASSLIPTKHDVAPSAPSPKLSQTTTAPLKSLTINTLPQESLSVALSMGLQPPSPQRNVRADSPMHSPTRSRSKPTENLSIAIPDSSTFLPDAETERPNILTGTPVPIRSPMLSPVRSPTGAAVVVMKENTSPKPRVARRSRRENLDPKTHIQVSVVETSETDDAIREARLRLAARGRNCS